MSDGMPPRIGVVICDCGDEIAGQMDMEALCRHASTQPGVVYAYHEAFPCSKDGQARIECAIADHKLERLLVAGCTTRLMSKLFSQTLKSAGLEPDYLDVRNIREHCVYVHPSERDAAFHKAVDLIGMGVSRLEQITAPHEYHSSVLRSVMMIGSGLGSLTAAIALANSGIPVILIEGSDSLGGKPSILQQGAPDLIAESIQAISRLDHLQIFLNADLTDISGYPGQYRVEVTQGGDRQIFQVGAIVIATGAQQKSLEEGIWYDRRRVKTQVEYAAELETSTTLSHRKEASNVVMVLYGEEDDGRCSPLSCMTSIRQAVTTKELAPESNVTILFRHLFLGGVGDQGEAEFARAKDIGVNFFRYQQAYPPVIGESTIGVHDQLTDETLQIPYDRVVLAMPFIPDENADRLAALLRLPQDENGFIIEPRHRLRPGRYVDDGIFVMGAAHQPVDTPETLFQAFTTSARVLRFLDQETVQFEAPVAEIESKLCTGCGYCAQVCPMSAIHLEKRDGVLSLSEVDPMRCTGCGNCVVVCPVRAIAMPGWNDAAILAQINAALQPMPRPPETMEGHRTPPRVLVLACEWSAFAAADMAGARRYSYPSEVRLIRMNCSARFDPNHILWAFLCGADGVFLGTCLPGECHYGTGNLFAKERADVLKKQLADHDILPGRLRLEFFSPDDGLNFAQAMTHFVKSLKMESPGQNLTQVRFYKDEEKIND